MTTSRKDMLAWLEALAGGFAGLSAPRELDLMEEAWVAAHDKYAPPPGLPQYASMEWQKRWNGSEAVASLSQSGPEVMAGAFFGTLTFSLDDDESVAAIVNAARQFADMVEETKQSYDAAVL